MTSNAEFKKLVKPFLDRATRIHGMSMSAQSEKNRHMVASIYYPGSDERLAKLSKPLAKLSASPEGKHCRLSFDLFTLFRCVLISFPLVIALGFWTRISAS